MSKILYYYKTYFKEQVQENFNLNLKPCTMGRIFYQIQLKLDDASYIGVDPTQMQCCTIYQIRSNSDSMMHRIQEQIKFRYNDDLYSRLDPTQIQCCTVYQIRSNTDTMMHRIQGQIQFGYNDAPYIGLDLTHIQ